MKLPDFRPHSLAIFWDLESGEFQPSISESRYLQYWNLFLQSIQFLYPNGSIFSNIDIPHLTKIQSNFLQYSFETLHSHSEIEFFKLIHSRLPAMKIGNEDWDEVCFLYLPGVAPLMDRELCKEFWGRHIRYFSQYSYSENLPDGIIPKVLTREFLDSLPATLPVSSHDYFLKNINNYDVEIFFKKPDLRQYRLSLVPNNHRSAYLINRILDSTMGVEDSKENPTPNWRYENLPTFLRNHPDSMRPAPSWIELEIFRGCEMLCTFCPRQYIDNSKDGNRLSPQSIQKLVEEKNSIPGNITYCLGGMGEPLLHPNLSTIIRELLKTKDLQEIIIESTLAVDWSIIEDRVISVYRELNTAQSRMIQFIVNITTLKEDRYTTLYGKNKLALIHANLKNLSAILPKSSISVQILKIQETEDEVEKYFDYFEKEGFPIIFQKYNRYINLMPEKRVSDLTPLGRDFCWHLGRDLYVESDGTVKICKQGLKEDSPKIGNILMEKLDAIWTRGLEHFSLSLNGNHDSIPMSCLNCDEWYTFNA